MYGLFILILMPLEFETLSSSPSNLFTEGKPKLEAEVGVVEVEVVVEAAGVAAAAVSAGEEPQEEEEDHREAVAEGLEAEEVGVLEEEEDRNSFVGFLHLGFEFI